MKAPAATASEDADEQAAAAEVVRPVAASIAAEISAKELPVPLLPPVCVKLPVPEAAHVLGGCRQQAAAEAVRAAAGGEVAEIEVPGMLLPPDCRNVAVPEEPTTREPAADNWPLPLRLYAPLLPAP